MFCDAKSYCQIHLAPIWRLYTRIKCMRDKKRKEEKWRKQQQMSENRWSFPNGAFTNEIAKCFSISIANADNK